MFLIPILIIVAVVALNYAGDVFKGVGFSLPKLNLGFANTSKQQEAPQQTQRPSPTLRQAPPTRAPPEQQQSQKAQPTVSPYFKKIRISNFQKTEVQPFRLTLSASFSEDAPINITGWRVKGTFLGEFTIGRGIEKYHPVFAAQPVENILVKRSDTISISGAQSPLGRGMNFRTNSCFGYLKQYTPLLPGSSSCSQDRPLLEEIKYLAPACQEFILNKINFSSCIVPDLGAVGTNQECVSYVSAFSYQGCYEKRNREQNFLSNEWHIYADTFLGHFLRDTITLYDQNDLVVDSFSY